VRAGKQQLVEDIQRCIDAGLLPRGLNAAVAFSLLTMGIFGVAAMRLSQRVAPTLDVDAAAADMLDVILAGLQSGIALRSQAVVCHGDLLTEEIPS
jgi:uncharacterized protein YqfA (UPF0365 family)